MGRIKSSVFVMVVVFMGSYLGGMTTEYFFAKPAEAKKEKLIEADRIVARSLHIVDAKGRQKAVFGEAGAYKILQFLGRNGKPRVGLMYGKNEIGVLRFSDEKDNSRVLLGYTPKVAGGLGLFDENGNVRLELEYLENNQSGLFIYDSKVNHGTIKLFSLENGTRGLFLADQKEKEKIVLGVSPKGEAEFGMKDDSGTLRAGIIQRSQDVKFGIRNGKGETIWSAP